MGHGQERRTHDPPMGTRRSSGQSYSGLLHWHDDIQGCSNLIKACFSRAIAPPLHMRKDTLDLAVHRAARTLSEQISRTNTATRGLRHLRCVWSHSNRDARGACEAAMDPGDTAQMSLQVLRLAWLSATRPARCRYGARASNVEPTNPFPPSRSRYQIGFEGRFVELASSISPMRKSQNMSIYPCDGALVP